MLSSLMNGVTGGVGDLGGDEDLGEWNPYLGQYVKRGFEGLPAYEPPVAPVAPVAPIAPLDHVAPIAVDPMCRWCTRVGK